MGFALRIVHDQLKFSLGIADDSSKLEVLSRTEQGTAVLTKLKLIRRDKNISLGSKMRVIRTLVTLNISVCLEISDLDTFIFPFDH